MFYKIEDLKECRDGMYNLRTLITDKQCENTEIEDYLNDYISIGKDQRPAIVASRELMVQAVGTKIQSGYEELLKILDNEIAQIEDDISRG